jgi:hypothetical protein
LYLADLLGDSELLQHFQESKKHQQQQQQRPQLQQQDEQPHSQQAEQQQAEQQQQQQQQHAVPRRAVAPPAPIWQAWASQYATAALNQPTAAATAGNATVSASIAAPTAASAWYMQHQQQYQQQQQQLGVLRGFNPGSKGNSSSSSSTVAQKQGSSFDKYAAAVLQGLPPEDEAVQLAHMAAVHGYSLSDVLQQQQQQYASRAGAGHLATSASGITVTADGVTAHRVKDPRSGRLSVAAGSNGGSSGGAAELYGDMARWCDPASLERMLLKRRQQHEQQQQQGLERGGVGGAAKRTRS